MTDKQNTNATGTATGANENGTSEAGNKTFTQQDLDALAGKVRSEEKAKNEKAIQEAVSTAIAEYERKAKLTQEEKDKEAREKREKELADRELEITMRERAIEAKESLLKEGVPVDLVDFVVHADKKKTEENITKLAAAYKKAVEDGVTEKLKGETPEDFKNKKGEKKEIIRSF